MSLLMSRVREDHSKDRGGREGSYLPVLKASTPGFRIKGMSTPKERVAMAATGRAQSGACTEPQLEREGGKGGK